MLDVYIRHGQSGDKTPIFAQLTAREREIVSCWPKGRSNKAVSALLERPQRRRHRRHGMRVPIPVAPGIWITDVEPSNERACWRDTRVT